VLAGGEWDGDFVVNLPDFFDWTLVFHGLDHSAIRRKQQRFCGQASWLWLSLTCDV
jgi:hypothetical protein